MQIRPVSKLKVLNVQLSKDKYPPKTFVRLNFDGKDLPEIALKGEHQPAAGDKTVAAFEEGDDGLLLAWLDPQTGQCFHVWHHTLAQSVAALLAGILCFYIFPDWDTYLPWQQAAFSLPLAGGAAWLLLAPGIKQQRLEKALKKKSEELYASKGKAK
ncbi:hypothetical protein SAMN05660284_00113 [Formivibrio citricus]|uniref:Uncharacterized protein n=1 Tax=Formivibrio citricus TaxID=83765 RepID=A0A1I4V3T5_9NEIS|nr:hypothetical protein [Formivibrio citricus]SFM95897.1 hypothetical protein SAMN05660284_00113 [Formivibrio citricus]